MSKTLGPENTDTLGVGYSSTANESGTDNLPTPANTPSRTRKSHRRSNLFTHVSWLTLGLMLI